MQIHQHTGWSFTSQTDKQAYNAEGEWKPSVALCTLAVNTLPALLQSGNGFGINQHMYGAAHHQPYLSPTNREVLFYFQQCP